MTYLDCQLFGAHGLVISAYIVFCECLQYSHTNKQAKRVTQPMKEVRLCLWDKLLEFYMKSTATTTEKRAQMAYKDDKG